MSARWFNVSALLFAIALPLLSGCSSDVKAYQKKPPPTGKAAALPPPPTLANRPKKEGDAFTVYGLIHDLHSKVHSHEVKGKRVSVVGYIVKTNMTACKLDTKAVEEECAPVCSFPEDKGGKAQETPADCKAPAPTFWIADKLDEKSEMIAVMGWASNFAGIRRAIEFMDKDGKKTCEKPDECKDGSVCESGTCQFMDQQGKILPNPLPTVGAKVKITTDYGPTYKGFGTPASEPKYGILGPKTEKLIIEVLQEGPELANLPTLKPRKVAKDDKKK